jgi:hypothetical protein
MRTAAAVLVALAAALPLAGGVRYNFESRTTGLQQSVVRGSARAEGSSARIDIADGDGMIFRDATYLLSRDGGKTLTVVDPSSKTWYVLSSGALTGNGSLLGVLGDAVRIAAGNPRVVTRDRGAGGVISGYPTRRSLTSSAFDVALDVMGQKSAMRFDISSESWATDRLPPELAKLLRLGNVRTGIAAVDRAFDAVANVKGFPLRQIVTIRITQNGRVLESTTTTTIRDVEQKAIGANEFVVPAGYTRVASPLERR